MRIWSLHPRYLDSKGLVALWRETLLAQKILAGGMKGYRNHPQLNRFKACAEMVAAVGTYLSYIEVEAASRVYNFDETKIIETREGLEMTVTEGQMAYEWSHLLKKLAVRDPDRMEACSPGELPECHPMFVLVEGDVESWEIV
jgi:hypothetical protein